MKVVLEIYHQTTKVRDCVLEQLPLVIGRSADSDIQLNDRWVSRQHCKVDFQDGVVVVQDLESRHGTLVNDKPITVSKLFPGDTLCIGLSRLVACYEASEVDSKAAQHEGLNATCES
jgi:pSer/pThr/pTyr-binding forkhead associated (FHA) protein